MAQITSRKELEAWLKDKPADWAQVIFIRSALRMFPDSLLPVALLEWGKDYPLILFRTASLAWAVRSLSSRLRRRAIYRSVDASKACIVAAKRTNSIDDNALVTTFHAARAVHSKYFISQTLRAATAHEPVWFSLPEDCSWLEKQGSFSTAALDLSRLQLWPMSPADKWSKAWDQATSTLLNIDQTYQVWIDWYNRRIEGHSAAFHIPYDTNRTQDKAVLALLAGATDGDFWNKGATYVNTTLQSWIDEARERAAIDYVASGAPLKLGSDAELAARDELASRLASVEAALAALKDQLASLTQTGHGGIGHNQPENATSLRDDEIITLKQQVASLETLLTGVQTQLAKPVPDVGQLVQDMPKLNRWGYGVMWLASVTSEMVAEGFEKEIGAAGAKGLVAGLVAVVLAALAAFSHYFYTYWIPLLIG